MWLGLFADWSIIGEEGPGSFCQGLYDGCWLKEPKPSCVYCVSRFGNLLLEDWCFCFNSVLDTYLPVLPIVVQPFAEKKV